MTDPTADPAPVPGPDPADTLVLGPDCTVRAIEGTCRAIRLARPPDGLLRLDCGGVVQADLSLVQLVVSAQRTFAARGVRLVVDPAAACVLSAFSRSGISRPGTEQPSHSEETPWQPC